MERIKGSYQTSSDVESSDSKEENNNKGTIL